VTTLADVRDAILAAVVSTGATPSDRSVTWGDDKRPAAKYPILLDVVSAIALHDRQTETVPDPTGAPGVTSWALSTYYELRVQVRAESIYNTSAADALFTLERVRAGLLRPDLELTDGIAIVPDLTTTTRQISFASDGRVVSSYSFEIAVRAVVDYPSTGAPAGTTVREVLVEGESEVLDDGSPALTELDIVAP
jgi:hypothetical protein